MRRKLLVLLLLTTPALALVSRKLSNGLTLLYAPQPGTGLVTLLLSVRTGAMHETPQTNGLAHLYEHMFFKGNKTYPDQEAFTQKMRALGMVHNGTTGNESVRYYFTLPKENFRKGLAFLSDALLTPLFDRKELERERKVVLGEYDRFESDPDYALYRAMEKKMFWKYFYRKNPIGNRKVIAAATRQQMLAFKNRYYAPNNSALVVVGDISLKEVLSGVQGLVKMWKRDSVPSVTELPPHPPLLQKKSVIVEKKGGYALVSILFRGPDVRSSPKETFAADLFSALANLPSSRFQKDLVESGFFTSLSFTYYTQQDGGEIWLEGKTSQEKLLGAVSALAKELPQLSLSGYFTEEELNQAKLAIKVQREKAAEDPIGKANDIGFWWAVAGVPYYQNYLASVKQITTSDLLNFLQQYINGKPFVIGALVPPTFSFRSELQKAMESVSPSFPSQLIVKKGALPILFQPMATPTAHLEVVFPGGSLHLNPNNAGIEALLFSTLTQGSRKYPKEKLHSTLQKYGARLSFWNSYDASAVTLDAPSATFLQALPLLGDSLLEPLLDPSEILLQRQKLLVSLRREEADPDSKVFRLANELFFQGHPYEHSPQGTPESLNTISREDLLSHLATLLQSSPFVVVTGPLLPDLVEKALSPLKTLFSPSPPNTLKAPPPFSAAKERVKFTHRSIPTDYIVGKWPLPNLHAKSYPVVRLTIALLSEKIEEVVRTKHALSYAVFMGMANYRANFGYLYITTTEPKKSFSLIHQVLKSCRVKAFPKKWVDGVKGVLLTRERLKLATPEGRARALVQAKLDGAPLELALKWTEKLTPLSPADVQQVCQTLIAPMQMGVLGPKPFTP